MASMRYDNSHVQENPRALAIIQNSGLLNEDANESIFFARELEYIKPQAYDVKRPLLSALALIPISTEAGPGAETITYQVYDTVGMAKIISNYADDLPRADVKGKEVTTKVVGVGVSYGYSVQEIRAAVTAGKPLTARKMMAARKAHEEKINQLAWNGDAVTNLPGFLTNVNIPLYTIPATGTGATKTWSTKTPDQILMDLNGMITTPSANSKNVHNATELWLPTAQYDLIARVPRSSTSDTTILEFFLRVNPGVTVKKVNELDGAGDSGTDRAVSLENDRMNFNLELPMMFMQHAPQPRNLEFVVPCESRFGGCVVYYPLAFAFGDGI